MGRVRKEARLRLRQGVWYIIDGEMRISTGCIEDHEEQAQTHLATYIAAKLRDVPNENPTVNDILNAYEKMKFSERKRQAFDKAYKQARIDLVDPEEAMEIAEKAGLAVANAGQESVIIRHLRRHIGHFLAADIGNNIATLYSEKRRKDPVKRFNRLLDGEMDENGHKKPMQTIQPPTVRRELVILRAAINWAFKENRKHYFPDLSAPPNFKIDDKENDPRDRFLTREEADRLIDACQVPHLKLFIKIALKTGARKEAIENLKWTDIDFDINVINFGHVQHNKRRPHIPISADFADELAHAKRYSTSEFVLEWRGKRAGDVKMGIKRAAQKAGLPWVTPHVFKHTMISWVVSSGEMSLDDLAAIVKTTPATLRKHYAHLLPDNARKLAEVTKTAREQKVVAFKR